ncbi:hypothetical protein AB0A77_14700 [Streptomyces varsoviensis]|uniref:hypothetical protein n=1 Tax=Streptomyces varsoviensis TaxID=67373 RepID=UPI0033C4CEC6
MTKDEQRPDALHETWWRAPLIASVPGAPILVWEETLFYGDGYVSAIETLVWGAMALLVLAWVLPHRRAMRELRIAAAGISLGCSALPFGFAVLLGAAMASG